MHRRRRAVPAPLLQTSRLPTGSRGPRAPTLRTRRETGCRCGEGTAGSIECYCCDDTAASAHIRIAPPVSRSFIRTHRTLQTAWMDPGTEPLAWWEQHHSPRPAQQQTERRWSVVRKFSSSLEDVHKNRPKSARCVRRPTADPPLTERPSSGTKNGLCACLDGGASDADADSLAALRAMCVRACACVRLRARLCVRCSPPEVAQHIPLAHHRLRCATRASCYLNRAVATGLSLCLFVVCICHTHTHSLTHTHNSGEFDTTTVFDTPYSATCMQWR